MIRETRTFWNHKTKRYEVWLDLVGGAVEAPRWLVLEHGPQEEVREYPDTDDGYRAARLDYGRRVTQRVWGDERNRPGVYGGFDSVTPETVDYFIESQDNCEEIIGARIDVPRARSLARFLTHWVEHGELPSDKNPEEWLFVRAYPDGRNKARDAAQRLYQALKAEWQDRPDMRPLLLELAAEHPWIEEAP